ncbi:MAG: NAD(P)-binding domain-containing protein [Caldilineaceae bacterium]
MSLAGSKIAFIGSGAMAEAIIKGMLSRGLVTADQIVASDPVSARQTLMAETYNVQTTGDNNQAVTGANIVVMSIKPQAFAKVAAGLQGHLARKATKSAAQANTILHFNAPIGPEHSCCAITMATWQWPEATDLASASCRTARWYVACV